MASSVTLFTALLLSWGRHRSYGDYWRSAMGLEGRAPGCPAAIFDFLFVSWTLGNSIRYAYPNRGLPFHVQLVFKQKRPRATREVRLNPIVASVEEVVD